MALVLLSGLAIGVWLLFFSGRNPQPGAPPENVGTPRDSQPSPEERSYTLEQASQLLRDKNRALGLLENEKLVEVEPLWTELATRVPDDPLPTRNLVVTRLLMLKAGEVISKTDLTEQLYEQDFERDSNVIEVFIGRLRRKLGVGLIVSAYRPAHGACATRLAVIPLASAERGDASSAGTSEIRQSPVHFHSYENEETVHERAQRCPYPIPDRRLVEPRTVHTRFRPGCPHPRSRTGHDHVDRRGRRRGRAHLAQPPEVK